MKIEQFITEMLTGVFAATVYVLIALILVYIATAVDAYVTVCSEVQEYNQALAENPHQEDGEVMNCWECELRMILGKSFHGKGCPNIGKRYDKVTRIWVK